MFLIEQLDFSSAACSVRQSFSVAWKPCFKYLNLEHGQPRFSENVTLVHASWPAGASSGSTASRASSTSGAPNIRRRVKISQALECGGARGLSAPAPLSPSRGTRKQKIGGWVGGSSCHDSDAAADTSIPDQSKNRSGRTIANCIKGPLHEFVQCRKSTSTCTQSSYSVRGDFFADG